MMLASIRDSDHTIFLLSALECETGIQSCVVTDRSAKSISEIYFVEEKLFTLNTFKKYGSQKKCCRYLCKEYRTTSTVSHKRTTQNNGKTLNDGIWAEYKEN
jgi:hypothetical protein